MKNYAGYNTDTDHCRINKTAVYRPVLLGTDGLQFRQKCSPWTQTLVRSKEV